jgi:hypothetical protein
MHCVKPNKTPVARAFSKGALDESPTTRFKVDAASRKVAAEMSVDKSSIFEYLGATVAPNITVAIHIPRLS